MSFAIIETGGKQYKVSASKILEIEKLNVKIGETIKFQNVLLLNDDKTTEIGSPSIDGATVEAKLLDNVKMVKAPEDALDQASALIIVTEWKAFRSPDFEILKQTMKNPIIFDGRNLYEPQTMKELGFEYQGIGRHN